MDTAGAIDATDHTMFWLMHDGQQAEACGVADMQAIVHGVRWLAGTQGGGRAGRQGTPRRRGSVAGGAAAGWPAGVPRRQQLVTAARSPPPRVQLVKWAYKGKCGLDGYTVARTCIGQAGTPAEGRECGRGRRQLCVCLPVSRLPAYPPVPPCPPCRRLARARHAVAQGRQHRPHLHPRVREDAGHAEPGVALR